jgi:hypothetical protein
MENFTTYHLTSEDDVSSENFEKMIQNAISFLKESNNLGDDSIRKNRLSLDHSCLIGNRHFVGQ